MTILLVVFTIILVLLSLFMVLVVLMQRPKADSGLGAALGGGGAAESAFGAETGNVLQRTTIICVVAFFLLTFGLYLGGMFEAHRGEGDARHLPDIPEEEAVGEPEETPAEPLEEDFPVVPEATDPEIPEDEAMEPADPGEEPATVPPPAGAETEGEPEPPADP